MTLPGLIDTHAHLDHEKLKSDLPRVIRTAREAGVVQVVAIATGAEDSRSVLAMSKANPGIFASVGIHPNDVIEAALGDWEAVEELARQPRVHAIGETGLDRYWKKTPFELQQESFARHLELGRELNLPVVIHCRDCMEDILAQLEALGRPVKGVLHSFTGTAADAERLVALGLHISFAGMLTFANKSLDPLRDAAKVIPADRLLVETDSPYLSPEPFRGKQNEPAKVVHTAAKLAALRGLDLAELAQVTTANARRLFGLPNDEFLVG